MHFNTGSLKRPLNHCWSVLTVYNLNLKKNCLEIICLFTRSLSFSLDFPVILAIQKWHKLAGTVDIFPGLEVLRLTGYLQRVRRRRCFHCCFVQAYPRLQSEVPAELAEMALDSGQPDSHGRSASRLLQQLL